MGKMNYLRRVSISRQGMLCFDKVENRSCDSRSTKSKKRPFSFNRADRNHDDSDRSKKWVFLESKKCRSAQSIVFYQESFELRSLWSSLRLVPLSEYQFRYKEAGIPHPAVHPRHKSDGRFLDGHLTSNCVRKSRTKIGSRPFFCFSWNVASPLYYILNWQGHAVRADSNEWMGDNGFPSGWESVPHEVRGDDFSIIGRMNPQLSWLYRESASEGWYAHSFSYQFQISSHLGSLLFLRLGFQRYDFDESLRISSWVQFRLSWINFLEVILLDPARVSGVFLSEIEKRKKWEKTGVMITPGFSLGHGSSIKSRPGISCSVIAIFVFLSRPKMRVQERQPAPQQQRRRQPKQQQERARRRREHAIRQIFERLFSFAFPIGFSLFFFLKRKEWGSHLGSRPFQGRCWFQGIPRTVQIQGPRDSCWNLFC